jgi:hypothetical protein
MTDETELTESRPRGEAAWKATLGATEQRNAAAKRRAQEHKTTSEAAAVERERGLALAESAELRVLNEQIVAREASRSEPVDGVKDMRGLER